VNDNSLTVKRLSEAEWESASDEQRLSHILSGGALKIEQAREILEFIEEDITYERQYISSETSTTGTTIPLLVDANSVPNTAALGTQPSNKLLSLENAWQWTEEAVTNEELLRLRARRLQEIDRIQQALRQCLEELSARHSNISKPRNRSLPKNLPQQTCMEVRTAAIAIADGKSLRRWHEVEGENSLTHVIPGDPIRTILTAGHALDWWGLPTTYSSLRDELRRLELPAVLLLNILIGAALKHSHLSATLDELINSLGWKPRFVTKRHEMRKKIWRWLLLFDSMTVHGKRPGIYRDHLTRKVIDLTSADALIKLTGLRGPTQPAFDNSEPPIEISWVVGPWLDQLKDNTHVLQFFGEINKLTSIPSGKPSGAWAQSIGLALNQLWRERASRAKVSHAGDDSHVTVIFDPPFTRYELLNMFRADPWVEDVLNSSNPQRAKNYWKEAIRILKRDVGVVSYCEDINTGTFQQKRLGWQESWLHQELDVRPKNEWIKVVAELSKKRTKRQRALAKKKN
jgi:hypothetical protein